MSDPARFTKMVDDGIRLYASWRASALGRNANPDPLWEELDHDTQMRWCELAYVYDISRRRT